MSDILYINICSHSVLLLATLEVFCRKNFSYTVINKLQPVCLTDEDVFCNKICEILHRFSLFQGFLVEF